MSFTEQIKKLLTEGAQASKGFLSNAGEKIQDIGEWGTVNVEMYQLSKQAQKLFTTLGEKVYDLFENQETVSREEESIASLFDELTEIQKKLEERENTLKEKTKDKS
ncbi:hypothetical protein PilKf_01089 [Pillotina sp. SPG140]|jgi:hypothetical protein